jgi:hypothetical protein
MCERSDACPTTLPRLDSPLVKHVVDIPERRHVRVRRTAPSPYPQDGGSARRKNETVAKLEGKDTFIRQVVGQLQSENIPMETAHDFKVAGKEGDVLASGRIYRHCKSAMLEASTSY